MRAILVQLVPALIARTMRILRVSVGICMGRVRPERARHRFQFVMQRAGVTLVNYIKEELAVSMSREWGAVFSLQRERVGVPLHATRCTV